MCVISLLFIRKIGCFAVIRKPLLYMSFVGYSKPKEPKSTAYKSAKLLNPNLPYIILVSPQLDQNVGSVARAMLNFGLSELRIVNPECDFRSNLAKGIAAGSSEILENAKVFNSVKECVSDLQRVFATTVRKRETTHLIFTPGAGAKSALENNRIKVGIMFGRESDGLNSEEVSFADSIITIPSNPNFSSLNLAQSVNIICYELWKINLENLNAGPPGEWIQSDSPLAKKDSLDNFFRRLETQLQMRGYRKFEEAESKDLVIKSIRVLFQRARMTEKEVEFMHGVISKLMMPPITENELK